MAPRLGLESIPEGGMSSAHEMEVRGQQFREELESLRDRVTKQAELRGRLKAQLAAAESAAPPPAEPSVEPWQPLRDKARELELDYQSALVAIQAAWPKTPRVVATSRTSKYLDSASGYLRELSGGAFSRIGFRSGRRGAALQERDGHWISITRLRPEHFANLYFALWLARIERRADTGIRYPVVMQDPLSITSRTRKPAVAGLLREFAAKGHQMLIVTADEHHARIFARLGVPIADLSNRESQLEAESSVDWGDAPGNGVTRSGRGPVTTPSLRSAEDWG
ncbi:MAG TPA: hypothetical protein VIY86_13685, partial [Pirellulaceae bacterium]